MTQKALAKAAGVKQPSISELETGETKVISGDTLVAVAGALGVRSEWLVNGRGERDASPVHEVTQDEREILAKYRAASPRWRIALQHLAGLNPQAQEEVSEGTMVLLAKVSAEAVPDARLGRNWTRPDKKHP